MTSTLVSQPQVQGCSALLTPAQPPIGPGTAYIEQTFDQQFWPNNSTYTTDLTSVIQQTSGFIPQCVEIVNPCGTNFDVIVQAGQFAQRIKVPAGFICRRKLIFSSTPLRVFLSWNNQIGSVGSPFIAAQGSLLRVRIYNFPLNDEDVSLWHFYGPLSAQIVPGATGQITLWSPSDTLKIYKIRRLDLTVYNTTTAAAISVGFFTTMYVPSVPVTSPVGAGRLFVTVNVPAAWVQQFSLLDNMGNDTDGWLLSQGFNAFDAYVNGTISANMVIAVNILIDMFDPLLGQSQGFLT